MVKRPSSEERREQIAEAVWRVIRRDGMAAASVRTVADEAGMSTGSLRHFFATQSELLLFAMELVSVRVENRIAGIEFDPDIRRAIRQFAEQFVPLDADRREEMQVWEAFAAASRTEPDLAVVRERTDRTLFGHFRQFVEALSDSGFLRSGSSIDSEAMRLHALVDGLAAHGVNNPERVNPAAITEVLDAHFDSLITAAGSSD
ncbi:TetR/AcrR family transcriptional regulator [Rhodococcus globerulus]|uniref:TetR family transcriptional regulator n=1 Tax=Nocardia globerula TaxID=1818 RepID=A0A652YTH3_NOCGL|nr:MULTISPECIES: TetR/AcrR family transcriptional regulator [Rhodococcus]KJF21184.1 transcriptional regulator BetI [Rhodococcus sp. AD45]NMD61063.1 TetR/AcrR family transcriptional regulator [Nocardia globerula]MCE4266597.1 TetR/AcrR family transcriptional regulator [Rhodococcus globerulus]PVX67385.1 TetR family transcriptional regulator [Rhodococcus globerulus]QXW02437.1 TetR/AcrR family transcriptional regulator [Rhodococcus globerulus]